MQYAFGPNVDCAMLILRSINCIFNDRVFLSEIKIMLNNGENLEFALFWPIDALKNKLSEER